ncbi:MAG: N-acetylglutamate synthase [Betaproteobacteria bacterium]|nr:N-acetylglutamate synthase [Betaproteobacteria bacterium]MEA3156563.1 amino-acid N-acetyltransferase [Betaproteobacteria bacterium]
MRYAVYQERSISSKENKEARGEAANESSQPLRRQRLSSQDRFIDWFQSVAPYIHAFRGKIFVIAFGGDLVADGRFFDLTHDLNLLAALGVQLVLVHGARPQIEARLKERRHSSRFHKGLRVSDDLALAAAKEASGRLRVEIEALLSMGLPNSPMAGADIRVASGNFITAKPLGVLDGVDYMHTGEVRKVHAAAIHKRLGDNELVLLSPLGYSPTGEVFNLALEDVAASTAMALGAEKLIFMMDTPGVTGKRGELLRELTVKQAKARIARSGEAETDVQFYLPWAVRACEQGVKRAHLISNHIDDALLLELFTHKGVGTLITPDPIQTLRPARSDDIGGILRLLEPLEAEGILVKRNRSLLESEISRFVVIEHDGIVIACAALYPFLDEQAGELAGLAVQPDFRNQGAGERLLKEIELRARRMKLKRLVVLTTRAEHWFVERGFTETDIEALPAPKRVLYNWQRRSVVLVKRI